MQKIELNSVTSFSQIVAIVLFVAVFFLGFFLGRKSMQPHEPTAKLETVQSTATTTDTITNKLKEIPINLVHYTCNNGKYINATIFPSRADVALSDGRSLSLQQTRSTIGARYANAHEAFVFWIKSKSAYVVEGKVTTFNGCYTK